MPLNRYETIRALIRRNNLEEAIPQLSALTADKTIRIQIDVLASRHNDAQSKNRMGVADPAALGTELNAIKKGLLEITDLLEASSREKNRLYLAIVLAILLLPAGWCAYQYSKSPQQDNAGINVSPKTETPENQVVSEAAPSPGLKGKDVPKQPVESAAITPPSPPVQEPSIRYTTRRIIIRYSKWPNPKIWINRERVFARDTLFPNHSHGLIVDFPQPEGRRYNTLEIKDPYDRIQCRDSFPAVSVPFQEITPCF